MDQRQLEKSLDLFPPPRGVLPVGRSLVWPARPTARLRGIPSKPPPTIVRQLDAMRLTAVTAETSSATVDLAIDTSLPHSQEYHLVIGERGVNLRAADLPGALYGLQTLEQIIASQGKTIPGLEIQDWPAMARRGFYLDVSRGKVPTVEKLKSIIEYLARLRYNEFQIYIENVFEFPGHDFYADTTPLTAAEMQQLDQTCADYGIDFVPSLTSLGHFDKILRHPRYRHLAEIEPADLAAQGVKSWCDDPWTLCISDPAAAELISELYDAFLPNFSSRHFNICCDESWDLALGRSRQYAARIGGVGEAYVRWINHCAAMAARHGKSIALWGDIILNHPEKMSSLPQDATLLEWGYEADHPFDQHGEIFARTGRPWYVCPGTSSWQSFGGRLDTALANIRSAVAAGQRHGAAGMLLTDWGDYGHQQCFVVSVLPVIAGGGVAWNPQTPDSAIYTFAGRMVGDQRAIAHLKRLGMLHGRIATRRPRNSSLEFRLFREPPSEHTYLDMLDIQAAKEALVELEQSITAVDQSPLRINAHLQHGLVISLKMSAIAIGHGLRRLGEVGAPESAAQRDRIKALAAQYQIHWHRWNKPSRWVDIQYWFDRLIRQV